MEYDVLLNNIVSLIAILMVEEKISSLDKNVIFEKSVKLLTNYLGSADNLERFEKAFRTLFINRVITKQQLDFYFQNLNLGRWT